MLSAHLIGSILLLCFFFFFFNDPATTEIYTLSLHDALPIFECVSTSYNNARSTPDFAAMVAKSGVRSEEHTSELQSLRHLVCRLLLEKKKKKGNADDINGLNEPRPAAELSRLIIYYIGRLAT